MTRAQRECLQDAVRAGSLKRTACGWQTPDGKPITGHNVASVYALERAGLLSLDREPKHLAKLATPTGAGQAKALEFQGQALRSKS